MASCRGTIKVTNGGCIVNRNNDLAGMRFGRLIVRTKCGTTTAGASLWECICDCGNTKVVRNDHLKQGAIKSCGCIVRKHGLCKTKLYSVWQGMLKRCHRPGSHNYGMYGARGISVCDEWCNDFMVFHKWAIANGYKDGLAIDRIDNDGNYSPDNCRWATSKVNGNNRRTNKIVEYNGESKTVSQWASFFGVDYDIFYARMRNEGFSIDKYLKKYNA